MTQIDKNVIEKLYIMDVKTLLISKVIVNEVDECKFALFNFMDRKCTYWLRGANIQTLAVSQSYTYPRYVVSKDKKSLYWLKESFQWLIGDIGFILRDAWDKIYDEKFDTYKYKIMILFIFILIYLISVAIFLITCYYDNKHTIHNIGDLLDETVGFMWCPFINTVVIIVFCLCLGAIKLWELSKINILWEKFRNIRIR